MPGSPEARVTGRMPIAEGQGCEQLTINKPGPETGSTGKPLLLGLEGKRGTGKHGHPTASPWGLAEGWEWGSSPRLTAQPDCKEGN